jgi:hypothetical protein
MYHKLVGWLNGRSKMLEQLDEQLAAVHCMEVEAQRIQLIVQELCKQLETAQAGCVHLRNENAALRTALIDLVNAGSADIGIMQARGQDVLDHKY